MRERRPKLLDAGRLWEYALKALGDRAHSVGELREKLRRRAAVAADIDGVLARLKDCGYLNDRQYAESFASARLSGERMGRARVLRDLRQHRVAPALAEKAVREVYREVDEQALIDEWIRRKYRLAPRETLFRDDKDLGSAYRRLVRAGFRTGEIVSALKRFARNPELLDGFEPPPTEED
jgi:regulatory protein